MRCGEVARQVHIIKNKLWILVSVIVLLPQITHGINLEKYVRNESKKVGVNPLVAVWIVSKESQWRPEALGDDGQSRGLWQISKKYHPEVSDKCAFDYQCSTKWSLKQILKGKVHEWSTIRFCRKWYEDCPL